MKFVFVFLFLLLLGLSTFLSRPFYKAFLQNHMSEQIARNFQKAGIEGVGVEFDHLHASLRNEPLSNETVAATDQIDRVWGAYVAKEADSQPALPAPTLWAQRQDDGILRLRGQVASENDKAQLVQAAQGIKGISEVVDELEVVSVADAPWLKSASDFLPDLMAQSTNSELSISDEGVRVAGVVDDQSIHDRLAHTASQLPNSELSFEETLEVQPWQEPFWQVTATPSEAIVVEGLLPDTETQEALLNTIQASANGSPVDDRTTVAERVHPAWWGDHSEQLIPGLASRGTSGYFARYERDSVSARCLAGNEATRDELENLATNDLPNGVTPSTDFKIVADAPKVDLAAQLKLLPVYFGTDSSDIVADEESKIAKAADVINQSGGNIALTVGGYADLRGSAEYNRALSLRRASAVRSRLIAQGVAAERLDVKHFGEDTSEVADEDLWKSRRVELSITPVN